MDLAIGHKTSLDYLLKNDVNEIRIFSRDENKQHQMRREIKDLRVTFFIGDIRDDESVLDACDCVDYIFHAAALKQVPSCEFHPIEAVKTNVLVSSLFDLLSQSITIHY